MENLINKFVFWWLKKNHADAEKEAGRKHLAFFISNGFGSEKKFIFHTVYGDKGLNALLEDLKKYLPEGLRHE